jgi:hypothetical protein
MTSNVAKLVVVGVLVALGACGEEPLLDTSHEAAAQPLVEAETPVLGCEAAPAPQPVKLALTCPVNPEGTASLDCDADPSNGCEVDPYADAQNCGGCGLACPGEFPSCIQKRCCNVEDRECL